MWWIVVPVAFVVILTICVVSVFMVMDAAKHSKHNTKGGDNSPIFVDIHIPLSDTSAYDFVVADNRFLRQQFGALNVSSSEPGINFDTLDTPHITLYLTAFQCPGISTNDCLARVRESLQTVMKALSRQPACQITVTDPYPAGTYAMLNVSLTSCLQSYSDAVVNATHEFSQPNQAVPGWVMTLPEPLRSEKIRLVKQFGSPNVYQGFKPHVSVGWSANATLVASAVEQLRWKSHSFLPEMVAMGSVGPHGTVLSGKDIQEFPFK